MPKQKRKTVNEFFEALNKFENTVYAIDVEESERLLEAVSKACHGGLDPPSPDIELRVKS